MCKGPVRWHACRSRFVCNTSSPIQSRWKRPCPQTLSPCRVGRARCASCAKWHNVSRCHAAGTHTCPCPHLFAMPSPRPAVSRPATRRDLGRCEFDQESPCDRHGRSTFSDHCMPASSYHHPCPAREPAGQQRDHGCLGGTRAAKLPGHRCGVMGSLPAENPVDLCKCNSMRQWRGTFGPHDRWVVQRHAEHVPVHGPNQGLVAAVVLDEPAVHLDTEAGQP